MMPGATAIRKCSACGKLIEEPTIMSGNNIGARYWTDGKMEAPMMPDDPWLVKCPHCGALVWISDLEQIGEVSPWGEANPEVTGAQPYDTTSFADYLTVLRKGGLDKRKEKYLRLRAWWAGNDKRRKTRKTTPLSDQETANLLAYLALLDETDEDERLMRAEALRELGKYEDALAILAKPFNGRLNEVAGYVQGFATRRVSAVGEMPCQ